MIMASERARATIVIIIQLSLFISIIITVARYTTNCLARRAIKLILSLSRSTYCSLEQKKRPID